MLITFCYHSNLSVGDVVVDDCGVVVETLKQDWDLLIDFDLIAAVKRYNTL